MSGVPWQLMARNAPIPTPQAMEPMNGWFDEYSFDEVSHQSPAFDTTYSGDWHANMQFSGQIDPTFVNHSRNNPPSMQTAGQFTEAFVDPSLNIPTHMQINQTPNIPTHMQPAGQSTLTSLDQSRNTPTNIQDFGQFTTSATFQSDNISMHLQPLGQHTQAPIKDGGNTTTNVLPDGQAAQAPFHYSGSPCTNIPLDEQATPAPARFGGNGNKKTKATRRSPPASTKGRTKQPAFVEDKNIERCAGEYNISYNNIRILMDYANARLKGIETSEPKDAPSRYIISRFEQVRRTHPEHATWPYDIPEEKILRLLPGQKRQDRAPIKCHHSACEERRQELDARYHESRQWEGPPPPTTTPTQPGNVNTQSYLVDGRASSDDIHMASSEEAAQFQDYLFEEPDQLPSPLPTFKSAEQDYINPLANSDLPAVFDDSQIDYVFEEPDHVPSSLPTCTPTEQDNIKLSDIPNLLTESDDSQYGDLFQQFIDDSELDEYYDEPAQCPPKRRSKSRSSRGKTPSPLNISPLFSTNSDCARSTMPSSPSLLPPLAPSEHETPWPFHQGKPKEEHPFVLPHLDYWPAFAPIICHPLVRALELDTGRKDPSRHKEFKGYTIPVANYKARATQISAPADSGSTPEAQFMPQGYEMTEELRREIEQRIGIHMKLRWGMDADKDDDGKKATSGELVREDLRRLEDENRGWRYKMAYWVEKWGLGGVHGSELSEDYFLQMLCGGGWRECVSLGVDPIVEGS